MNVTDEDGDTPLYVVENIETARFLVEHGATVARQNAEGISVRIAISRLCTKLSAERSRSIIYIRIRICICSPHSTSRTRSSRQ